MIAGGLGVAVPSNAVQRFLRRQVQRPALGVTVQPVAIPTGGDKFTLGLLVMELTEQGSAEQAGLLLGDVLLGANGKPFQAPDDLLNAVAEIDAGETVHLDIMRGGQQQTREIELQSASTPGTVAA